MSDFTPFMSGLMLTSALLSAGTAFAQAAPVEETPNAESQCAKIESAESRKTCRDLGMIVNALKRNDFTEANRLQNIMMAEQAEKRKAERAEALNIFSGTPRP